MLHYLWLFLTVAGVINDIGGWLAGRFKNVRDLAGAVWKAIKHLWATVSTVFHHVGGAWASLWRAISMLDRALSFLADSMRNTLKWTIRNLNPKSVGHAISKAVSWSARQIAKFVHSLSGRITGIYRYFKKQVNSVSHRVTGIYRTLRKAVNTALHWITHQGKRVWTLLSSPDRLASWLTASLIKPIFRYIVGHIEALALMIGRWILGNIGKLAHELERALTKLL